LNPRVSPLLLTIFQRRTATNRPQLHPTGCNFKEALTGRHQRGERTINNVRKITHQIRKEAARQMRGFPREIKYQLRGFGGEAAHQVGKGWGEEFARQIFGTSKHRRRRG
jgi:hypothetical protein